VDRATACTEARGLNVAKVQISREVHDLIRTVADNFISTAMPVHGTSDLEIGVSEDVLDYIAEHRLPGEHINDTLLRLLTMFTTGKH
jgi:hypothetical protein